MAEIIPFLPRAEIGARENVAAFVRLCRDKLSVFGTDLVFDAGSWDITEFIERKGRGKGRLRLVFANLDVSRNSRGNPMAEPFLSFAKAYVRYMHGLRPTKGIGHRLSALRALERALSEAGAVPRVEHADASTFTRAASLVRSRLKRSAYVVGRELETLAAFCTKNRLTTVPIPWKSPLKRPQDRNRVGAEADKDRLKKMPSEAALDALPEAFCLATEPADVIVTSAAAILCGSPDRINELLALQVDCEVRQKRPNGEVAYGLRWWPAKGAEPMVKWIIPTMAEAVKWAICRLRQHTDEARSIARWYEDHPDQVYLPEEFEHLRDEEHIAFDDVAALTGITRKKVPRWLTAKGVERQGSRCLFSDFQQAVLGTMPKGFPLLFRDAGLRYSEALFIVPHNHLRKGAIPSRCMIEPVTTGHINDGLGARVAHGVSSVFTRLGFQEPDGSPIRITSHQFRHWLNTLAQRGGLSQLDIAKWSGRKDIRQNEVYDHMTGDELLSKLREIAGDDPNLFDLPTELRERLPISREEFIKLQIPAAHMTELGVCVHDWTFLPCQQHRDCVHCAEHCYIKGDQERMSRIRQLLGTAEQQLQLAEKAAEEEYAGADRWSEHQRATVARLRNLVDIMDDPQVPAGTMIRLATPEMPSSIQQAMDERSARRGRIAR